MAGRPLRRARLAQMLMEQGRQEEREAFVPEPEPVRPQPIRYTMTPPVRVPRPPAEDDGLPHFDSDAGPVAADEAASGDPVEGLRDRLRILGQSDKLSALTELALERANDILSIRLDPTMPDYMRLMQLQQQTLTAVLSTQAKVDESQLRKQQGDRLGEILDKIRAEGAL
jgi:hypothetical protein